MAEHMADQEIPPDLYTTEKLNFLRLSSILIDEGTPCVRQIFDKSLKGLPLPTFLERKKTKLKSLVGKESRKKLYPENPDEVPISINFDLTLLFVLLKEMPDKDKNNGEKKLNAELFKDLSQEQRNELLDILDKLRDKRNGLYAHKTSCRIETELYNKELQELREILVNQLPKYGCDTPNIDRWTTAHIASSDDEVTSRQVKLRKLTENDKSDMLIVAEQLIKNITMSLAMDKELEGLCGEVAEQLQASSQGKDTDNSLGASVGRLVDMLVSRNPRMQNSLFQLLSRLDGPLNDFGDKLKKEFENYMDTMKQTEQKSDILSDANPDEEAEKKERKWKENEEEDDNGNQYREAMVNNFSKIVKSMDSGLVLDHPSSVHIFNQQERDYIQSRGQLSNGLLLNVMEHKLVNKIKLFIEVLKGTGQPDVAYMVENGQH
jgi:hypothetical protein